MSVQGSGKAKTQTTTKTAEEKINQAAKTLGVDVGNEKPSDAPTIVPISQIMEQYNTPSNLEGEGKEYLERLVTAISEQASAVIIPIITDMMECRVVMDANKQVGVVLIFAETYRGIDDVPPTEYIPDIVKRFKATVGGKLLQTIVIAKEDYPKANRMANHIVGQIDMALGNVDLNIDNFKADKYFCTTDINKVKQFVADRSPHGIPARADIGLLLYATKRKEGVVRYGEPEFINIPILAITGYTTFTATANNKYGMNSSASRFVPCVTISDIVTNRSYKELIPIALPIAAHQFIREHGWLRPFNTFGINNANIGNLAIDPETAKPWVCKTVEERNRFIEECVELPPFFAIDITEGRARISGIDRYACAMDSIVAEVQGFLRYNLSLNESPVVGEVRQFDGYIKNKDGNMVDSRTVDYLYLCKNGIDPKKASEFLYQPKDPQKRMVQISNIHPEHKTLYSTTKVVLHGTFVSRIGACLESTMNITFDSVNTAFDDGFANIIGSKANTYNNFNLGYQNTGFYQYGSGNYYM